MAEALNHKMEGDDGNMKAQPSGPKGDNPATSGSSETITTAVPERTEGQINPSSPANTGTTPGTNAANG